MSSLQADQSMGGGPSSLSNKQNMDYDSDSQATELDDLDYFANDIMQQPDDNEDDGDSDLAGPSAFTHDHSNGNHVSMDMHDDLWPADEEEDDDDSPPIGQDMDLEELLAWGSGEIELKGMPTAGTSNSNGIWYEDHLDFLGIEVATDADSSENDTDDSLDSVEEAEQLLAIQSGFASDSDGSLGDGDTTDSLDDTDHDALVRYGIEEAEPDIQAIQPAASPRAEKKKKKSKKRGSRKRTSSSSEDHDEPASKQAAVSQEPLMGQFEPRKTVKETVLVIEAPKSLLISPFSIKKMRKLAPKCLQEQRSRRGSEASSSYASSAPVSNPDANGAPQLNVPTLIVPESEGPQEEMYMDLDLGDILEASALEGEDDFGFYLEEASPHGEAPSAVTRNSDAAEAAFERWTRIPIGAFRRAGQDGVEAFSPETAVRRGSKDEVFLPISAAVFSSAGSPAALNLHSPSKVKRSKRVKISRKDAIALSPILYPVQTTGMPTNDSGIRSRKERRADNKRDRKTRSSASQQAREGHTPLKSRSSRQPDDMLLPPSSTLPMSAGIGSSTNGMISPSIMPSEGIFNTTPNPTSFAGPTADNEVPPLDMPEAAGYLDFN